MQVNFGKLVFGSLEQWYKPKYIVKPYSAFRFTELKDRSPRLKAYMIFHIIYACLFHVSGTEVRVPSLVKRASAEVIDCLILLLVKFFISYLLIHYGGFKWVSVIHRTLTIEQFYHYRTLPSIVSLHLLPSNISFLHQRTNEKFALDRAVSFSGR